MFRKPTLYHLKLSKFTHIFWQLEFFFLKFCCPKFFGEIVSRGATTFAVKKLSLKTLGISTIRKVTLSIKPFTITIKNGTRHYIIYNVFMLSTVIITALIKQIIACVFRVNVVAPLRFPGFKSIFWKYFSRFDTIPFHVLTHFKHLQFGELHAFW